MGDVLARRGQGVVEERFEGGSVTSNWTARSVPKRDGKKLSHGLALIAFVQALYALSSRFHTSAAFERPYHLSIISLIFCSIALKASQRWTAHGGAGGGEKRTYTGHGDDTSLLRRLQRREGVVEKIVGISKIISGQRVGVSNRKFWLIAGGIILRVLAHWYIIRTIQCSIPGLEAFLVIFVLAIEYYMSRGSTTPTKPERWAKFKLSMFVKFSISWAVASMAAISYARIPTGAVCPLAWHYSAFVPYLQVQMCVIDAVLIVTFSRLRQEEEQTGKLPGYAEDELKAPSRSTLGHRSTLIRLALVSALVLFLLSFPSWLEDRNFFWYLWFRWVDIKAMVIDGLYVTSALGNGLYLLDVLSGSTIALLASSVGLFGVHIPYYAVSDIMPPLEVAGIDYRMTFAGLNAAPLFFLLRSPTATSRPAITAALHRWLFLSFLAIAGVCALFHFAASTPDTLFSLSEAIKELNVMGRNEFAVWRVQGSMSNTVELAVAEYTKRHGVPPPPNFDMWFRFAIENESPIIDDFAQIHSDLLPFWGVPPAEIRRQIHEIQRYASVEMVGLRIRNGAVDKSPHIHETHQWMIDSVANMVEPFAQYLPDMDVPINVADEPRVALPFAEMQRLKSEASRALGRLEYNSDNKDGIRKSVVHAPHWPSEFPESIGKEGKIILPNGFSNYIRKPILYDLIAPTCPPYSPIQNTRWWDHSTACTACLRPHSIRTTAGPLLHNETLAMDFCHQPDTAYLTGSVASPSAMFAASKNLLPVFSQGKISGFSDILMPSPWSFDDLSPYNSTEDPRWDNKKESLFWRGGSTDGYAAEGSWTGFTRARFVNEAAKRTESLPQRVPNAKYDHLSINVSFSGELSRCHSADCKAELSSFTSWARLTNSALDPKTHLPAKVPFNEHWRHKHLIDLDGAGFSGRFIPFLKSSSLVYRAAMYRTWMDERVFPWAHYVPVDIRIGTSFWAMVDWFAGADRKRKLERKKAGGKLEGESEGELIARDIARSGSEWAGRALRREDMQIYMFRLLLEWGRIVDDEREHLFYEG